MMRQLVCRDIPVTLKPQVAHKMRSHQPLDLVPTKCGRRKIKNGKFKKKGKLKMGNQKIENQKKKRKIKVGKSKWENQK